MNIIKKFFRLVSTWSEDTQETEGYLRYNGYIGATRIFNSKYYLCRRVGALLSDVKIVM